MESVLGNMRSHEASGRAYSRFRRSLDNGNLLAARAAATELQHVGLAEALELTLLLAKEPARCRAPLARPLLRRHESLARGGDRRARPPRHARRPAG